MIYIVIIFRGEGPSKAVTANSYRDSPKSFIRAKYTYMLLHVNVNTYYMVLHVKFYYMLHGNKCYMVLHVCGIYVILTMEFMLFRMWNLCYFVCGIYDNPSVQFIIVHLSNLILFVCGIVLYCMLLGITRYMVLHVKCFYLFCMSNLCYSVFGI